MTDTEIIIMVKNMAVEMVDKIALSAKNGLKYKFKVGDKVNYTNSNGVNWGTKTITGLDERSGEPTYHIKPTDTPWYSVRESELRKI